MGKYFIDDYLFAVDHHGQLLFSSCVLVLSNKEVLTVYYGLMECC
jgi:hypothetical protein